MQHAWPISLNVAAAARWPFRQINKSNERPRFISVQSATSASDGPLPRIFNELYSKLTLAPLTVGSHKWPWQLSLNPFEFQMRQPPWRPPRRFYFSPTTQHGATRGFCLPAAISTTVHHRNRTKNFAISDPEIIQGEINGRIDKPVCLWVFNCGRIPQRMCHQRRPLTLGT